MAIHTIEVSTINVDLLREEFIAAGWLTPRFIYKGTTLTVDLPENVDALAMRNVVLNHDPNGLSSRQQQEAAIEQKVVTAKDVYRNVPGWTTISPDDVRSRFNNYRTQIDSISTVAHVQTALTTVVNDMERLALVLIALRDVTWPEDDLS